MSFFRGLLILIFTITNIISVNAQCAMCRAQLENNVSEGEIGIAAGINIGIMYLFATPYIVVAVVAYLWYRNSRKNQAVQV